MKKTTEIFICDLCEKPRHDVSRLTGIGVTQMSENYLHQFERHICSQCQKRVAEHYNTFDGLAYARRALEIIRQAGSNEDTTAVWMQQWAAHALGPEKFGKPDEKPPVQQPAPNDDAKDQLIDAICRSIDKDETAVQSYRTIRDYIELFNKSGPFGPTKAEKLIEEIKHEFRKSVDNAAIANRIRNLIGE